MWRSGLARKLEKIVGREALVDAEEELRRYQSGDAPSPKFVCLPTTAQQISQILQLAVENKTTVLTQLVGLTPAKALSGNYIYLDLRRFNKIVKIDPVNLCAVVQPQVTLTALRAAIAPQEVDLAVIDNESTTIATTPNLANAVIGLEVVLPRGRIAYIGGHSGVGYSILGWFLESQSTFGIVIEMTLELRWLERVELTTRPSPHDHSSEGEIYGRIQHHLNQPSCLNPQGILGQG